MVVMVTPVFQLLRFWLPFCAALMLFFGVGCANRVSPSGGLKDETPPVVILTTPNNKTVNFKEKTITIKFNEYITLNNPQTEIFITPFIKEKPDFKLRGKNLIIKFKEELLPNTTYTFNFGKCLQDLTEGNVLNGFEYAFSTGSHIDSLFFTGAVLQAENNEPAKDVLVLVYKSAADTLFTSAPPAQIARTDDKGIFRVSNLAAGTYFAYALIDKNANYFYDQANESIAFFTDSINLAPDTLFTPPTIALRLFNEGLGKARLMERNNKEYGHLELIFSKPLDSVYLQLPDTSLIRNTYLVETSANKDTLHVWYKDLPNQEPISFLLYTNPPEPPDTVFFRRTARVQLLQDVKYISNARGGRGVSSINYNSDLWLKFNHPIIQIDTGKIQLYEDTVLLKTTNKQVKLYNYRMLHFTYPWNPEKKYKLVLPDSTLIDYHDIANDEIELMFNTYSPDTYGTLLVKMKGVPADTVSYLIYLYDANYKLIRQLPFTDNPTLMPLLKPGEYKLVIAADLNKNGKWDTGNYAQKQQPEPVFAPKTPVTIREDWETEIELELK